MVEEVKVDEDGLVRRVWIRTAKQSYLERHVNGLVLLEAVPDEEEVAESGELEAEEVSEETTPKQLEGLPVVEEDEGIDEGEELNLDLSVEDHPIVLPPRRAKVAAAAEIKRAF